MKLKSIILTAIIGLLLLIIGSGLAVHARLVANHSPIAFDESGDGSTAEKATLSCSRSIRELVIISAGYFLKGQSHINTLSEQVELSDIQGADFYNLWAKVGDSKENIYNAWYYYKQLEVRANHTPYNKAVIAKLSAFDYDHFQEKNGLVKDVFKDVKAYLVKGDVRGVYSRISADIEKIYFILEDVQTAVYWGTIPDNEKMWNLNQQCAKTHLFGQYVARVFNKVR